MIFFFKFERCCIRPVIAIYFKLDKKILTRFITTFSVSIVILPTRSRFIKSALQKKSLNLITFTELLVVVI